jgi:hypothetical protein
VSATGTASKFSNVAKVTVAAAEVGGGGGPGGGGLTVTETPIEENPDLEEPVVPLASLEYLEMNEHRVYIQGYADGNVRPNDSISRAEAATIFYRLLQDKYQNSEQLTTFNDVSGDVWFSKAIGTLASLGIVKGYTDGTFRPNNPITRAEFTALIAGFGKIQMQSGNVFEDVPSSHWAADYINSAYVKGWIRGYSDATFKPAQNITRAEVAKIVNTMLYRLPTELPSNLLNPFNDLSDTHWAYIHILEASTVHTYTRNESDIEFWEANTFT